MSLSLSVISLKGRPPSHPLLLTLDRQDATIGRQADNRWILPDPERFVSSHHARIEYRDPHYFLIDTSTNGVFINHSGTPLGNGNRVRLADGDIVTIGEYEIAVAVTATSDQMNAATIPDALQHDDANSLDDDPFAGLGADPIGRIIDQEAPMASAGNEAFDDTPPTPVPSDFEMDLFEQGPPKDPLRTAEPDYAFSLDEALPPMREKPTDQRAASRKTPSLDAGCEIPEDWRTDETVEPGDVFQPDGTASGSEASQEQDRPRRISSPEKAPAATVPSVEPGVTDVFETTDERWPITEPETGPAVEKGAPTKQPSPRDEPPIPSSTAGVDVPDEWVIEQDGGEEYRRQPEPVDPRSPAAEQSIRPRPPKTADAPAAGVSTASAGEASPLHDAMIRKLIEGAQIRDHGTAQMLQQPETFLLLGKIIRTAIQGAMDVLLVRAKLKNEMRLDVTTIRPDRNNPIKFSVSADEALAKLLTSHDRGYLPPDRAIEEVFDDINAHQIAVLAGMQTAIQSLLQRFDPETLEQRLQQQSPISASIPIHKQAKLWRLFKELHTEIEQEAEVNFYHLFGEAFSQAYDEQIRQLKQAKRGSPIE